MNAMATKSILKTVHIKDSESARRLANALEYAKGKHAREVTMSRMVSEASRDEIRAIFGVKQTDDGIQDCKS